jgi:hypothetical protein
MTLNSQAASQLPAAPPRFAGRMKGPKAGPLRARDRLPVAALRALGWVCAGLLFGGCTTADPDRFSLPDGQISEALGRRLAGTQPLDGGARLQMSDLRLRTLAGTDRVRVDFDARIDDPARDAPLMDRWALDARLQWSASDCALRMVQVQMDLPPAERPVDFPARQQAVRHAARLARALDGLALWTPPDTLAGCGAMQLRVDARAVALVPLR